jgi:hypothetical protein
MGIRHLPKLMLEMVKNENVLKLTDENGKPHYVHCEFEDTAATETRRALKETLEQIKNGLRRDEDQPPLTVKDAADALQFLFKRGISTMVNVFGDDREKLTKIFRDNFPAWAVGRSPAVISMSADLSRFVPLEFLPVFDLDWPGIHDLESLQEAARRFPGFSAIIKREFKNVQVPQDTVLRGDPKLPLKCFFEQSLPGAAVEVEFFRANQDIDLEGPWPDSKLTGFPDLLAQFLQFAEQSFKGGLRSQADQIQHFVCHCVVNERIPSNSSLILSEENEVTIADLQAALQPPGKLGDREPGPLIFLNACGSSSMDPMVVASFPRFFLRDNHNRGFIGTETNVPDAFAAAFSGCFYDDLLKGVRLGEAIYNAKWKMLSNANNPLGILYTFYADPDMVLNKEKSK